MDFDFSSFGLEEPNGSSIDIPPWEVDEASPAQERAQLEVYRKADKFKKLSLLSGSSIKGSVEEEVIARYGSEGLMRLKLAKFLLGKLGYRQSSDVLLMLACTKPAKVVIATAGAGKTTSLQFDIIISKMIDMVNKRNELVPMLIEGTSVTVPRVLYLNYNRHNKGPIVQKHVQMCSNVNAVIAEKVDNSIESETVHALCRKWLLAAIADETVEVPVKAVDLISEDTKTEVWKSLILPRWKKFYGDEPCRASVELMDELHNFKTESMLEWDAFFETAKFVDSGLEPEFVQSCLKKYESMKRSMGLMDFIDYLVVFLDVLKKNPEFRARLQERYKLIIADENQDFTALMNELLLQLYNPATNRLIVVGDPDQVIYAFKGVSPVNVVDLVERLEDVETLGLDTNYRCPDNIIEAAKNILDLNVLRFDKPLHGVRTGGNIIKVPMESKTAQPQLIISTLQKQIGPDNYKNTVLSYRNNKTAVILGEELYYAGIPFKVIDSNRPFNNKYFRHIYSALSALFKQNNMSANKELFRFLPVSKQDWITILELNEERRHIHIDDLQMPVNSPNGLREAFAILREISHCVADRKCSEYVHPLFTLYHKYYFDFLLHRLDPEDPAVELMVLQMERTELFFQRPYTFKYMADELQERNVDNPRGVTMSTFHGLKGLEFDYVLAADFDESIFPNWENIDVRYSANTAIEERESENRLAYVLVTRTIKTLFLFYLESDPSVYVKILCGDGSMNKGVSTQGEKADVLDVASIGSTSKSVASKMDFIIRMTGGRQG